MDFKGIECELFLEKNVRLMIEEIRHDQIHNFVIEKDSSEHSITIRCEQMRICLDQNIHIKTGDWMVLLGNNGHNTTTYHLNITSDNCCHLFGSIGPIYVIDCSNSNHFYSNDWCCGQNNDKDCISSLAEQFDCDLQINDNIEECMTTSITNDHKLIQFGANPAEVDHKMRTFSEQYFSKTECSESKKSLSDKLNSYLVTVIDSICLRANTQLLDSAPQLVLLSSPSIAFGDIHGNLMDLYDYETLFWKSGKPSMDKVIFLFLGDFVDRGKHSVECALYLILQKLLSPQKFQLIRGNHEVRECNKNYSFYAECCEKYGQKSGEKIWDSINTCFERLPIAAVVDKTVFCCHGGIPKSMTTLSQIASAPKPMVRPDVECPGAHEILWNDPVESMSTFNAKTLKRLEEKKVSFIANRTRDTGFYYTEYAVNNFFKTNQLTYMIRAHESVEKGYQFHFSGQVVTVFSSSNYNGKNNTTACFGIDKQKIRPIILRCPLGLHTADHHCDQV